MTLTIRPYAPAHYSMDASIYGQILPDTYHAADKRTMHSNKINNNKQNSYAACEWDNWLSHWSGGGGSSNNDIHSTTSTSIFAYIAPSSHVFFTHTIFYTPNKRFTHREWNVMWWVQCMFSYRYKRFDSFVSVSFIFLRSLNSSNNQREKKRSKNFNWMRNVCFILSTFACMFS